MEWDTFSLNIDLWWKTWYQHLWWGVCLTARQAHQHQPDEAAGGDKEEGDDDRFHLVLQSVGDKAQRDADDTGDESGCQPNPPNLLVCVTKRSNLVHHHTHVSIYHPLEKDCHGSRWLGDATQKKQRDFLGIFPKCRTPPPPLLGTPVSKKTSSQKLGRCASRRVHSV